VGDSGPSSLVPLGRRIDRRTRRRPVAQAAGERCARRSSSERGSCTNLEVLGFVRCDRADPGLTRPSRAARLGRRLLSGRAGLPSVLRRPGGSSIARPARSFRHLSPRVPDSTAIGGYPRLMHPRRPNAPAREIPANWTLFARVIAAELVDRTQEVTERGAFGTLEPLRSPKRARNQPKAPASTRVGTTWNSLICRPFCGRGSLPRLPENRGVPGSSPGLAISRNACKSATSAARVGRPH
jgi:hypothetical protein